MDMIKPDLIQQFADEYGYTKKSAKALINDFIDIVINNLRNGNSVSLRGFGKFELLERKSRSCPDPQTGETVEIPAHYIPRFYPGKQMKLAVKMWEDDTKRGLM